VSGCFGFSSLELLESLELLSSDELCATVTAGGA
jgi:hypothetical protein